MHVQWTNLPLRPLFMPLVARLVFQLAGTTISRPQLIAGNPWILPGSDRDGVSVEITRPGGDIVRINRPADATAPGPIQFTNTHAVGIYEARIRRGNQTERAALAVNPDPKKQLPHASVWMTSNHDSATQRPSCFVMIPAMLRK